jgi:hypothetical protein
MASRCREVKRGVAVVVVMMVPGEREEGEKTFCQGVRMDFVGADHARRAVFSSLDYKQ